MAEPEPVKIDLAEVNIQASQDPFHAMRGRAIEVYASLEQSLCSLFCNFGDIHPKIGSVIFFKITSSRVRDAIMEKMLKIKHESNYSLFWNSLAKLLDQVSQTRNHIVHWSTSANIGDTGFTHIALIPPNFWAYDENSPSITNKDLLDFINKCALFSRLCNMFDFFLTPQKRALWSTADAQTWQDIFQQALTYPPPNTHPIFQTGIVQGILPPPSPASPPQP